MPRICEACERANAEVVEPGDDPGEFYHVCAACQHRLRTRALRPLEWYNLAKRHGWDQYFLHDDFYDDNGAAAQPEVPVEHPNDFPSPTLSQVAHDAQLLLDYSITQWHLVPEIAAAWARLDRTSVLAALSERFASNSNGTIRCRVLEVCASALHEAGADFVRYAWGDYPETVHLPSLAQASAACLPVREGFDRVAVALAQLQGSRKRDVMFSLAYFHSRDALDWIEQNIFEPFTDSWGHLAAASCFDWARAERWFDHARPLSLVAIDALAAIVEPRSPLLRTYGPRLHQPPTVEHFKQVLSTYGERDPVPRVQKGIDMLILRADALVKPA
jgi:hypothetical protein